MNAVLGKALLENSLPRVRERSRRAQPGELASGEKENAHEKHRPQPWQVRGRHARSHTLGFPDQAVSQPLRKDSAMASTWLCTSSFRRMFWMWLRTVACERSSRAEMLSAA